LRGNDDLFVREWKGAQGLAEDVRYYGQWMRDEAEQRIGHLYPKVEVTAEMVKERPDLKPYVGRKLTVIAWLWARTVKSPNPAFAKVDVPLASTFMLSTKAGKEAYVEVVREIEVREEEREARNSDPLTPHSSPFSPRPYHFTVKVGKPKDAEGAKNGTKLSRGANFQCLMSGMPIAGDYIKAEGKAGRMGARLMAIVAEGDRGRVYLAPTPEHEAAALKAKSEWRPEGDIATRMTGGNCTPYGLTSWGDLFTPRQLVALTTFSDLVAEARERVQRDALAAGLPDDDEPLRDGGTGATAYAEAVAVYLAFAVDKGANYWSSLCAWHQTRYGVVSTFGRQALPMVWDFAEANPISDSSGNILLGIEQASKMLEALGAGERGLAAQADASVQSTSADKIVSTDPPYYDNIGYADLSDFFYVWLRRSLRSVFPDLFATLAVPKAEELVATPYRHGSKEKAEAFFLGGMTQAMHRLAEQAHPAFPVTIYYAFKQSESGSDDGTTNTGWDTFLAAVIEAGFAISGTWPMRTEYTGNLKKGIGALASSIILVCRPRAASAPTATRREFLTALKAELPVALAHLQRGNIAPVDLAQAAIGPGMAVYTRYARVLDAEGKPLSVREALALINQTLDEALAEQEGDFDADSRWALTWFEQQGFAEGEYGVAEQLSKSKNTSVAGMVEAGIVESKRGKVRLLRPEELPAAWNPLTDRHRNDWEVVHHLIRALASGGEGAAAELVAKLGAKAEIARELAYRLYTLCERKKRAAEALAYNGLVQSWPEIARLAREDRQPRDGQAVLFEEIEE
jgi:putative DNA methylase